MAVVLCLGQCRESQKLNIQITNVRELKVSVWPLFIVSLPQSRVTWEKGTVTEKLPLSHLPLAMSVRD